MDVKNLLRKAEKNQQAKSNAWAEWVNIKLIKVLILSAPFFIKELGFKVIALKLSFFAILEKIIPAERNQSLRLFLFNIEIGILYSLGTYYLFSTFMSNMIVLSQKHLGSGFFDLQFSTGKNIIYQLLSGLLFIYTYDFFYYWFHRLQHTIPFLWAQHKIHHLDTNLNVSTSQRVHFTEELFRLPFITIPLAILFKFDPLPTGIIGTLIGLWGFFIHANLRINMRCLTKYIAGPQIHRIHHSIEKKHWNKNYSAFFPMWDVLFNTYYHPEKNDYPKTGMQGERLSSIMECALLPFKTWYKQFKKH